MNSLLHQIRMNNVLQFIESHIDEQLCVQSLAAISYYSAFHFHRLFRSYVGESVYAYHKRLLLERAVKQLLHSNVAVTEIAFNAGYANQASFNKAFKNQYLCSPSELRKKGALTQHHSAKSLDKENVYMQPTIKNIDAINVTSAREVGCYQEAAPRAWGRIMKYGYSNKLMKKEVRSIGISHDDPSVTAPEQIRYDACLDVDSYTNPEDNLLKYTISAGKYAIFLHKGAYENLQKTYHDIYHHWLPESECELKENEPCFEIYLNRDPRKTKPENLKTEIYIPLLT